MDDGPASYGTPTNGASPGSNDLLAQPPLQPEAAVAGGQGEGMFALSFHLRRSCIKLVQY
jgi:hypothetical protein